MLAFVLDVYFAAVLGVEGLGKAWQPGYLPRVLDQQRIIPRWSVGLVGRTIPWVEVLLACLLICGIQPFATGVAVVALFATFLAVRTKLFMSRSVAPCGCSRLAATARVEAADVLASTLLLLLALLHLGAEQYITPVSAAGRAGAFSLALVFFFWISWRHWSHRQQVAALVQP